MLFIELRQELCNYARKTVEQGLVVGPGGNISARIDNTMLLSPSGFAMEEITAEQWVEVDIPSGAVTDNGLRPSSEVLMHLFCYRANPSLGAIVHTHPSSCIAFTLVETVLPILFPDQAALVGRTAFVPYVVPTTAIMAERVAAKVKEACSILLGNHGLVTTGRNLREAYYRTQVVTESCRIYLDARALGPIKELTEEELREIKALEAEDYRIKLLQQMK